MRVVDQPAQLDRRQFELMREISGRQIREVGGRQALQVEARAPRAHQQLPRFGDDLQAHLRALGELAHDVVEDMGGDRGGAGDRHVGGGDFGRLQVEVGRLQFELAVLGLDQHIGEDRDRVAPLDDAVNVAERL